LNERKGVVNERKGKKLNEASLLLKAEGYFMKGRPIIWNARVE